METMLKPNWTDTKAEFGWGKTTLIKLLTGLYQPNKGRILLDGPGGCGLKRVKQKHGRFDPAFYRAANGVATFVDVLVFLGVFFLFGLPHNQLFKQWNDDEESLRWWLFCSSWNL